MGGNSRSKDDTITMFLSKIHERILRTQLPPTSLLPSRTNVNPRLFLQFNIPPRLPLQIRSTPSRILTQLVPPRSSIRSNDERGGRDGCESEGFEG
jgi:hypothetical protein